MTQKSFASACTRVFLSLFFISLLTNANAQFLNKLKKTVQDVQGAARGVTTATNEVNNTVKAVKAAQKTWKKDTSSNIKYQQIPDYRNREEVIISKKQNLSIENGQFQNLAWEPVTRFDNQIFPSFIIGWATYKGVKEDDMGSSLGFSIRTSLPNVVLKWEIESVDKNYFGIDSGYINCDDIRSTNIFMPKIAWNSRELTKHQTAAPVNVYFRLIDPNTGGKVEKLATINLRSINDCMTYYDNKSYRFLFTAFINEDHPEIDKILKEALDTKMISSISGYQPFHADHALSAAEYDDAKKKVDLQVAAIWRALHDRGFKYSSITDNSGDNSASKPVFSQTVRTFDNSVRTSQSNCVDGTVVLASILKRIGLRPILVTVPGHCFLAYYNDEKTTDDMTFLETTMLDKSNYLSTPKATVLKFKAFIEKNLPAGANLSELNKAYYMEFLAARETASQEFIDYSTKYKNVPNAVERFDVVKWRQYISPIPTYF